MENNQELFKLLKDYYEVNSFIQRFDEDEIDARDLKVLINKLESGLAEEITDKEGINKKVMFRLSDNMLVFNLKTENGSMVAVFSEDESRGITEFLKILLQSISLEISTPPKTYYWDVDYYDYEDDYEYEDEYHEEENDEYEEESQDKEDIEASIDLIIKLLDSVTKLKK